MADAIAVPRSADVIVGVPCGGAGRRADYSECGIGEFPIPPGELVSESVDRPGFLPKRRDSAGVSVGVVVAISGGEVHAMFTAGPARLVFPAAAPSTAPEHPVVARLVAFGRHTLCRLHGHAMLLHAEPERLSLRCLLCGAETPGWAIGVHPALRRGRH